MTTMSDAAPSAGPLKVERGLRHRIVSLLDQLARHPLRTVAVIAVVPRLALALWSFLFQDFLIPDEVQYEVLADIVSRGKPAEAFAPGYGQSLYDATHSFMAPLTFLNRFLGPSRLWGQVVAVSFGVVAVVGTAWLVMRALDRRWALAAGALGALLPSQVYFSSGGIRESMVWACVIAVAVGVALSVTCDRRRLLLGMGLAGVGLILLGDLRDQTCVAAAWSLVLVSPFLGRRRIERTALALLLAYVAPLLGGVGPWGYTLVEQALPGLGRYRVWMSLGAESSLTEPPAIPATTTTTTIPIPTTLPPTATTRSIPTTLPPTATTRPGGGAGGPSVPRPTTTMPPETTTTSPPPATTIVLRPGEVAIRGYEGEVYIIEESPAADFAALPKGVAAVVARPFPWEAARSRSQLPAVAENFVWYGLYVLAALGLWANRRRLDVVAFPVVVALASVVSSGIVQGNVGTAFRHRGQILWAIVILAALGASRVVSQRRAAQ